MIDEIICRGLYTLIDEDIDIPSVLKKSKMNLNCFFVRNCTLKPDYPVNKSIQVAQRCTRPDAFSLIRARTSSGVT